jgi:hypothetical protein
MERDRERDRDRDRDRERKGIERESTNALAILFLNRLGRRKKSANNAVLYRKEYYVVNSP